MIAMWIHWRVHIDARCHPCDIHPNRDEVAVDTGVHHQSGAFPTAIRAPRARNSVTMIQKMRPRIR
jgi:hypothetical protein